MKVYPGRIFLIIGFSPSYFKRVMPLPSGLYSFCWKVSWQPHGSSPLRNLLLLPCFSQYSLFLIFALLITVCLGVILFGLVLFGTLCFLDLGAYFLSQVRKIVSCHVFRKATCPFLSLLLGALLMWMLICLMFPWKSLILSSCLVIKKICFSFGLSDFPNSLAADSFSVSSFLYHLCITTKSFQCIFYFSYDILHFCLALLYIFSLFETCNFSLCSSSLLLSSLSIFTDHYLEHFFG